MSMDSTGCSGYVVKASAFTKFLPSELQATFANAISEQDTNLVDEILGENVPDPFPDFESAFVLKSEDTADNLEVGEVYVCFQDEDLYEMVPKPALNFLKGNGINPEFNRWTTWG